MTKPLKGISLLNDFGNMGVSYRVDCNCTSNDHSTVVWMNHRDEDEEAMSLYFNGISSSDIGIIKRISYALDMLAIGKYHVNADLLLDDEMCGNVIDTLTESYIKLIDKNGVPDINYNPMLRVSGISDGNGNHGNTVEIGSEVDMVGVYVESINHNDSCVTWKKRISMAASMLFRGYYEMDISLSLTKKHATMFIQSLNYIRRNK